MDGILTALPFLALPYRAASDLNLYGDTFFKFTYGYTAWKKTPLLLPGECSFLSAAKEDTFSFSLLGGDEGRIRFSDVVLKSPEKLNYLMRLRYEDLLEICEPDADADTGTTTGDGFAHVKEQQYVFEDSVDGLAQRKRTATGSIKTFIGSCSTVKSCQIVSISGKILSKSGLIWDRGSTKHAWVEIQDFSEGGRLKVCASGSMAEQLSNLKFLKTYAFHNFMMQHFGLRFKALALKEAWVEAQDHDLDPNHTWDKKEYGPLSDLGFMVGPLSDLEYGDELPPKREQYLHFILLFWNVVPCGEDWLYVDVKDEEGTMGRIRVHKSHEQHLQGGDFIVVHRAIMRAGSDVCDVPPEGMLAQAPISYIW